MQGTYCAQKSVDKIIILILYTPITNFHKEKLMRSTNSFIRNNETGANLTKEVNFETLVKETKSAKTFLDRGLEELMLLKDFPGGSEVKNPPARQEMQVQSLSQKYPLEKEMATHSSILPGKSHGQRSMTGYSPWGSHGVGCN